MSAIYKGLHHSVFSSLEILPPFPPFSSNTAHKRFSFHLTYRVCLPIKLTVKLRFYVFYSLWSYVVRLREGIERKIRPILPSTWGRDSSVGIATGYGLDGPGIEPRWGARFFAYVQTGLGTHPASCTMGTGSFPGVKRPGRGAYHPPLLAPRSRKSRAILLPPSGLSSLLRGTFTFYYQAHCRRRTKYTEDALGKAKRSCFRQRQ
jgi:hypothetical protein